MSLLLGNKKRPSDGSIVLTRLNSAKSSTRSSRTDLTQLSTPREGEVGQEGEEVYKEIEEAVKQLHGAGDEADGELMWN